MKHQNYTTGKYNVGKYNTGSFNSGHRNTGIHNVGNHNTGYRNVGDRNTGGWNTGNGNSGAFNITNHATGCFNTEPQKIMMFNRPSDWTYEDWERSAALAVLEKLFVAEDEYTSQVEKNAARQTWWDNLSDTEKSIIKSMPNFNAGIFERITGIRV